MKEFSTRQSYINALFGELRDGQQFYKIDLMLDVYWITSLGAIYIHTIHRRTGDKNSSVVA